MKSVPVITSFLLALGLFFGSLLAPNSAQAVACRKVLQSFEERALTAVPLSQQEKKVFEKMMLEGSLNVSRTKVVGRRFMAPQTVANGDISAIAEANFREAARYVLQNLSSLPIDLATATTLNKILTENLVPEDVRGSYAYRSQGAYRFEADAVVEGNVHKYYEWLSSQEARHLFATDPVALAERVHNNTVSFDSFPDGNGRLSRLFADLILMKAGFAPAYYTSMKDYFDRGNPRSEVGRKQRQEYFSEIVERGQKDWVQRSKPGSELYQSQ